MPGFLSKLLRKPEPNSAIAVSDAGVKNVARFEPAPEFATRLAVDSPGAPGRAGAEALYKKWAAKWQEF
jgi:hypothetical protein